MKLDLKLEHMKREHLNFSKNLEKNRSIDFTLTLLIIIGLSLLAIGFLITYAISNG